LPPIFYTMASSSRLSLVNGALTATTTGDPVSLSGCSKKFVGYIYASAVGAGTTVTGKIQHSPDKTNWFDLVTFTALVAVGSELKPESAFATANMPVLPNIRSVVTLAGGALTTTVRIDLYFDEDRK
jgi:hypothetical protein